MLTDIKSALESLMTAIERADGPTVAAEMAKLDAVLAQGRSAALHPQLVHFLQNRSYAKALMFVQGEGNIPAGRCGGGHGGA